MSNATPDVRQSVADKVGDAASNCVDPAKAATCLAAERATPAWGSPAG